MPKVYVLVLIKLPFSAKVWPWRWGYFNF